MWYLIWYLSSSFWLTSLGVIISRAIHLAVNDIISIFLWLSSIPSYICTTSFFCLCWVIVAVCGFLPLWSTGCRICGLSSCVRWAWLPGGMWDLSYLTRNGTWVPCIGRQILSHWTTREVPAPHLLYPFICPWTLRLFPYLGYYELCCYEHRGTFIFLNYNFLWIYVQEWGCWSILQLYYYFFEKPPYCFA